MRAWLAGFFQCVCDCLLDGHRLAFLPGHLPRRAFQLEAAGREDSVIFLVVYGVQGNTACLKSGSRRPKQAYRSLRFLSCKAHLAILTQL